MKRLRTAASRRASPPGAASAAARAAAAARTSSDDGLRSLCSRLRSARNRANPACSDWPFGPSLASGRPQSHTSCSCSSSAVVSCFAGAARSPASVLFCAARFFCATAVVLDAAVADGAGLVSVEGGGHHADDDEHGSIWLVSSAPNGIGEA